MKIQIELEFNSEGVVNLLEDMLTTMKFNGFIEDFGLKVVDNDKTEKK